jgi:hypothetical protein
MLLPLFKFNTMKILLLLLLFIGCKKEYSCEGTDCIGWPPSIDTIPVRTTPNELITSCSITIEDEKEVKWIYPEVTHKLHPGTWWIFDSIRMDGSKIYERSYDLKKYLPMSKFSLGDSLFIRYEIRYKFKPVEWVQLDTLLY